MLLKEKGFAQQVYSKYHAKCLKGDQRLVCILANGNAVHTAVQFKTKGVNAPKNKLSRNAMLNRLLVYWTFEIVKQDSQSFSGEKTHKCLSNHS